MEIAVAVETLKKAGFIVQKRDLLSNPDDTRDKGVFDPSVQGKTDRFLLLARKPGSVPLY
jgi:predicted methyltransferase